MEYKKEIIRLLENRSEGKSICPSEVLRRDERQDKAKMQAVRDAARELIEERIIVATQKGKNVDLATVVGPIRLKFLKTSG